ncbi:VanZ family protein [Chamaesiphon sp. OTE_8_metabat_110]|uniref:VanZ family protein n=1 Tax=Chamaesiphon sp. OTE_8_metabat_110 TaxID=2964696 RepID=UPI00286C082E|nr:VanZ family protein [Chamaesiphon sp. OTE_8_metabat_110]
MRLNRWLPFGLFLIFITGIIIGMNLGRFGRIVAVVNSLPLGDKGGHLLFIGMLTFLLNHALNGRMLKIGRLKILLGCTIVAVGITIEEVSQIWIPLRTFDLVDLAANYLGIAFAGWIWSIGNRV